MPVITLAAHPICGVVKVMADLDGPWAVHPTPLNIGGVNPDKWTLTHVASGFAFISQVSEEAARACLAAVKESALDWTLPEGPASLTAAHKAEGKELSARFGARPLSA